MGFETGLKRKDSRLLARTISSRRTKSSENP
jgi:hypothetical protein